MRNILSILLLMTAICVSLTSNAQTDDEEIAHAKGALSVTGSCDDALRFLDKVSAQGKTTPDYLLCSARANDCKSNNGQAIYYYNKYLVLQPANDSVKKRVAELSDLQAQQARVANEEGLAKASFEHGKYKQKKKRMVINDSYMMTGLSYDFSFGGDNAPYKNAVTLNGSGNYPIRHNSFTLGYSLSSSFLISQNANWYSKVFQIPVEEVPGPGMGFAETIMFLPMAVLVNKHNIALTAGPEIGFGLIIMSALSDSYGGVSTNSTQSFGLSYGLRSDLLLGRGFAFFIEYAGSGIRSVTTEAAGVSQSIPVNHDMFRIGICGRIDHHALGWF